MTTTASAVLASWSGDPPIIALLLLTAVLYIRGWLRARQFSAREGDTARLMCFLGGLAALFLALESPLDAFDALYLSAHMMQHLLLMMIAPPLLLLGRPVAPFLRGLPASFVKNGLGPFLSWPALTRVSQWITRPPVAWFAFAASTIAWHLPALYELALRSSFWHGAQHACFFWTGILFWWPVFEAAKGWPRWTMLPYLLLADIVNTALSAFLIFSDRILYPSYAVLRLGELNALQDQAAAGVIMWVPGSIIYIVPAVVIAMRLFSNSSPPQSGAGNPARSRLSSRPVRWRLRLPLLRRALQIVGSIVCIVPAIVIAMRLFSNSSPQTGAGNPARSRLSSRPRPRRNLRLPPLRRPLQIAMLLLAIVVMRDGFFGTPAAPLNLAGVLPWIHWRALSILALLIVGNFFCMVCPFTLVRDIGRRVLPAKARWPQWLRNKWLPAGLLLLYLWAYEAYSLWDKPVLTSCIIAAYFAAALAIDGVFRGASFCKYVCPIGQFQFLGSLLSPAEIRVRSRDVCHSCRTYDCIRGNERTRGCELQLFQPRKHGNMDCTFCLDCVSACPHGNVALMSATPANTLIVDPHQSSLGKLSKRTDVAVLAGVFVFGAFVNAAGMIGPVMMWQHRLHAWIGGNLMPAIIAAFVLAGAVVLPALAISLCGAVNRLQHLPVDTGGLTRRFVLALVPLGLAMWAAHAIYHVATYRSVVPDWLVPTQLMFLDAGLLVTLYVAWRVALTYSTKMRTASSIALPWAALGVTLYSIGIWVLFQPMQMRGAM